MAVYTHHITLRGVITNIYRSMLLEGLDFLTSLALNVQLGVQPSIIVAGIVLIFNIMYKMLFSTINPFDDQIYCVGSNFVLTVIFDLAEVGYVYVVQ